VSYTDHKDLKYIFMQLNLNLRQQRCLEVIKDCDIGINYCPGEAIMIADTLSRRSPLSQLVVGKMSFELCKEFDKLNHRIVANMKVVEMEEDSTLL
jgi:ferredoxin